SSGGILSRRWRMGSGCSLGVSFPSRGVRALARVPVREIRECLEGLADNQRHLKFRILTPCVENLGEPGQGLVPPVVNVRDDPAGVVGFRVVIAHAPSFPSRIFTTSYRTSFT